MTLIRNQAAIQRIADGREAEGKSVILGKGIINMLDLVAPGDVFYVDPGSGDDDNDGLSWLTAKLTLQAGIDLTAANNGDIILRGRGGEEVTTPVLFNKAGISVITAPYGASPNAMGELHAIYSAASLTDEPCAIITERCFIQGLGFVSRDTGATFWSGAALLIGGEADATPFGVHLHQCRFPKWGLDNRIGLAIEGSSDCLIDECYFEGVGADFDSGIYVQGATANLIIRRCVFQDCTYAIVYGSFAGGGPDAVIMSNVCRGSKLLSAAAAAPTIVADNWLMTATDATSFNATVDTLNALGIQMSDNHYAE